MSGTCGFHLHGPPQVTPGLQPLALLNSCPCHKLLQDATSVSDQESLSVSRGDWGGKEATVLRVCSELEVSHPWSFSCHLHHNPVGWVPLSPSYG